MSDSDSDSDSDRVDDTPLDHPDDPAAGDPTSAGDAADDDAVDEVDQEADGSEKAAGSRRVRRLLAYGAIAVLSLFALIAAVRFYLQASAAITNWIAPAYRSLFQAVFNFAVLLVAGGGVALLVRRLGE